VPVGDDQRQHLELARLVARRLEKTMGDLIVVPNAFIGKNGARVMGLDDATAKMSKSAPSEYNYISLGDDADLIRKKIKKAVTDSGTTIEFDEEKRLAVSNLVTIYSAFANKSVEDIVAQYQGRGYGDFKKDLAEIVVEGLAPIQKRIADVLADRPALEKLLTSGAERARAIAQPRMREIKKRIGLGV
jgi:tryptophanyl-tRNA synthetase